MKLLLYCTKAKPYLYKNPNVLPNEFDRYFLSKYDTFYSAFGDNLNYINGKIVGECDFDVEEIELNVEYMGLYYCGKTVNGWDGSLCEESQLDNWQLLDYLGDKIGNKGYAIHIKNLHIFDEPKELSNYFGTNLPNPKHIKFAKNWIGHYYWALGNYSLSNGKMSVNEIIKNFDYSISIKKAPQNMCYCYEKVGRGLYDFEKKVVISIRPEWLCKILTGEKTIEVRKKVLRCMYEK